MGCSESKNFDNEISYDSEEHIYSKEFTSEKENVYVIECLLLLKYLSLDNLLHSKISFDRNIIEVSNSEIIYKSENIINEKMMLMNDLLSITEVDLLRLLKKEEKKMSNIVPEEVFLKNDKNIDNLYLNDKMKLLLKTNAKEYYFNNYHKLKEKKSIFILYLYLIILKIYRISNKS